MAASPPNLHPPPCPTRPSGVWEYDPCFLPPLSSLSGESPVPAACAPRAVSWRRPPLTVRQIGYATCGQLRLGCCLASSWKRTEPVSPDRHGKVMGASLYDFSLPRSEWISRHSLSQVLSPSLDVCAQLLPIRSHHSPCWKLVLKPATVEGACQKLGWVNSRSWGLQMASFITQPFEGLSPTRHRDLKIASEPSCHSEGLGLAAGQHVCRTTYIHEGCSHILHPPRLPTGKKQVKKKKSSHSLKRRQNKSCPMVGQNLQFKKGSVCEPI